MDGIALMQKGEKMRKERQYAIEVLERHQHGKWGKEFYFGMYLPAFSKKDAEEVGIEELASMSFAEITSRCVDDRKKPWQFFEDNNEKDIPIGRSLAEKYFTCKAYIE